MFELPDIDLLNKYKMQQKKEIARKRRMLKPERIFQGFKKNRNFVQGRK